MRNTCIQTITRWLLVGLVALGIAGAPIEPALAAPPQAVATAVAPAGVYYPLLDSQGSLRVLTSSSGSIILRQSYDAWGAVRQRSGDTSLTTLDWAGERTGSTDGLSWLRARHYTPGLGRFLQRDTIVGSLQRPQSLNRYAGLEGNPANLTDPSGHLVVIIERDREGKTHPGFKAQVEAWLKHLKSQPHGNKLVSYLEGTRPFVIIEPASQTHIAMYGSAFAAPIGGDTIGGALLQADGKPGTGDGTFIAIDPTATDATLVVCGEDGREIAIPMFLSLGHELIHAQHNHSGLNSKRVAAKDPAYPNREEEQTIADAPGVTTENALRSEHKLPLRYGHQGRDTRTNPIPSQCPSQTVRP